MVSGEALDLRELVKPDRVHRRLYTDPAIFDLEMHRIFERTWVFVGHETEIPQPGDYKTTSVGRNPVIMSRDRDGEIHVLINRCRHRGAVVCRDERGNTSGFRCSYHGWTYTTRGELAIVTGRGGYGPEFHQEELGLVRAARVESYRGFVFACLSPEGDTLGEYLGKARHYIDLTLDASPDGEIDVRHGMQKYVYPGNWKFQVENWMDSYHAPITHEIAFGLRERRLAQPEGTTPVGGTEGSDGRRKGPDPYINTSFARGHATLNSKIGATSSWGRAAARYPEYLNTLEQRHGPDRARQVLDEADLQLLVFPNLFIQMRQGHIRVVRPVAVDRTEVHAYAYTLRGAPDGLNRDMIHQVGYWSSAAGFGQPDDVEAWIRCQEGLQTSADDWILFSRGVDSEWVEPDGEIVGPRTTEVPMRGIYREWKRLMSVDS
jgi:phenylpropionate dioxygenase-like ring-hydroxylating dioxygenase large terminal subunit